MTPDRPTLALSMIVRDEEEVLARCLDSVLGVVDELVIVDTGSKDRTKEIAAAYSDKAPGITHPDGRTTPGLTLADYEWRDDFAAARNFALEHVNADWVLYLDADEELRGEWAAALPTLLADESVHGYHVTVLIREEAQGAGSSFQALRLFRRDPALRFKYPIHEQVVIEEPYRSANAGELVIHHFGPAVRERSRERFERNVAILTKALEAHPDDAYFAATLGNEYFDAQDWRNAYRWYSQAMQTAAADENWLPRVACNAAMCLHVAGDSASALSLLESAAPHYPDYADLPFTMALILHESGRPEAAETLLLECIRMGDPPPVYPTIGGTGSWRAQQLLRQLRFRGRG